MPGRPGPGTHLPCFPPQKDQVFRASKRLRGTGQVFSEKGSRSPRAARGGKRKKRPRGPSAGGLGSSPSSWPAWRPGPVALLDEVKTMLLPLVIRRADRGGALKLSLGEPATHLCFHRIFLSWCLKSSGVSQ